MLTNFLHALVQSWDSASGQMAPVPPTVWLSKEDCDVCECVCVSARLSLIEREAERDRERDDYVFM